MRKAVKGLGVAAALAMLIALAPDVAASASVGGPTSPVPTGPGGPPPISLPPADGAAANILIYNHTNCDLVLTTNKLINGYYTGFPPQVMRTGTKLLFAQATATGTVVDTLDYGVVCDLTVGAPVVAQDTIELTFTLPYSGPPSYTLNDVDGDFPISVDNIKINGNELAMDISIH